MSTNPTKEISTLPGDIRKL